MNDTTDGFAVNVARLYWSSINRYGQQRGYRVVSALAGIVDWLHLKSLCTGDYRGDVVVSGVSLMLLNKYEIQTEALV